MEMLLPNLLPVQCVHKKLDTYFAPSSEPVKHSLHFSSMVHRKASSVMRWLGEFDINFHRMDNGAQQKQQNPQQPTKDRDFSKNTIPSRLLEVHHMTTTDRVLFRHTRRNHARVYVRFQAQRNKAT